MRVSQISGADCVPLAGAQVDIWHCDALGVYSDAADRSFNTQGQKFLRGYQVSDANGSVTFTTIYPLSECPTLSMGSGQIACTFVRARNISGMRVVITAGTNAANTLPLYELIATGT